MLFKGLSKRNRDRLPIFILEQGRALMPNLTASIPHELGRAEAKRRIQTHIGTLRQQHAAMVSNLQEDWTGATLKFSASALGQTISGRLDVDDQAIHLEVALPIFLSMLAGTVKERIEQQGRLLLANAPE